MPETKIHRVVIADDHPIFRAGMRSVLSELSGYEICAEAGNGKSCTTILEIDHPDILIMDLAMPEMDGFQVLSWIARRQYKIASIILSMHCSANYAKKAKSLGARAFVAKEDAAGELEHALKTPPGLFYLSSSVGGSRVQPVDMGTNKSDPQDVQFTNAERRILGLVGKSWTSKQIAQELGVSHRTVQTHRQNIAQKLGLKGPNSLLEYAILHGDFHSGGSEA